MQKGSYKNFSNNYFLFTSCTPTLLQHIHIIEHAILTINMQEEILFITFV